MKVLFAIDSLGTAVTEKSTLEIISNFSKDVQIVVVSFYSRDELKKDHESSAITFYDLRTSTKKSWILAIRDLRKIIKVEKPDVIVSSMFSSNIFARLASWNTNSKLVGTFISDSYSNIRTEQFSLKRKIVSHFFFLVDKLTSRIPVAWISNSNTIKKSNCLKLNIKPEKVDVVYRGRNALNFKPKQYGLKEGVFRFAFVARLFETKGLRELVEAFSIVIKQHKEVRLDIYGEGAFMETLIAIVKKFSLADKITLHGLVPNAWEKLYDSDCFVFPSWYEGFSGSLVEAMLVGIPIIASDIPMNLEAVTDNKTALVYEVKNTEQLAAKMIKAVTSYDKMIELGTAAREEALNRFDIKIVAAQYENILKRVAENR